MYTSWVYLQSLRRMWISQGHSNVPEPTCSCDFKGEGKPDVCEYKVKDKN